MRVSAKGRYALAAVVDIARRARREENIAVISISQNMGISKIYLEQIFTQLKKGGLLVSTKGSKGGYQLARHARSITVWDVLLSVESSLVEAAEPTVEENAPDVELALRTKVFEPLDAVVKQSMQAVTVQDLLDESDRQREEQSFMLNM